MAGCALPDGQARIEGKEETGQEMRSAVDGSGGILWDETA